MGDGGGCRRTIHSYGSTKSSSHPLLHLNSCYVVCTDSTIRMVTTQRMSGMVTVRVVTASMVTVRVLTVGMVTVGMVTVGRVMAR